MPARPAADHRDARGPVIARPPPSQRASTATRGLLRDRTGTTAGRRRATDRPRCGPAAGGRCRPSRRQHGRAAPVEQRHEAQPVGVPPGARPAANRIRRRGCRPCRPARRARRAQLARRTVELVLRQVDAAVAQVFADVAQDVGLLQRDAELVGVQRTSSGRSRAAEDDRHSRPTEPATHRQYATSSSKSAIRTSARSISTPSMSSSNAPSGTGKRRAASATATSTGSLAGRRACRDPCAPRQRRRLVRVSGRSPSPMSSIRRASA